ncbi:hypothetical protein LPJ66_009293 [Kickxella alabastrina]|uniref:Uncharacterized protein n=1 Tax=Kickxella alabastrina TaxID=61397 RepID=A0ACC1I477_9FUNG|nr:hypothetical protein LPJ66_009293 [Kickxella alabastrina]
MSSIASIISFGSSANKNTNDNAESVYSRALSTASFTYSNGQSLMPTPTPSEGLERLLSEEAETAYAAVVSSGRTTPVSAVLPSAATAAATAATAAADATRRRKVLTSRPPNSFILYRSDKLRELVKLHPELKQTQISKMCAENWKIESEEVKDCYRRKQQEAKTMFLTEQAMEVERISGSSSDKGIIKRIQPTNTFIRYRTEMKKKLSVQFASMNQKDVSRACGLMWRSEPEHVKMRYRQSYNKEKRDFERLCTTSSLEPSMEALSALASVIEFAKASAPATGTSTSAVDKKRRLSDGSHSAPVSPPLMISTITPPKEHESQAHSKRYRSLHATSHSMSSVSPMNSPGGFSLPSCASLISIADSSPKFADARPSALPSLNTRRSPTYASPSPMEHMHASQFPVPHGAFEAQQHPQTISYHKFAQYADQQTHRVYPGHYSHHRLAVSGIEYTDRDQLYQQQHQQHQYHHYQQQPIYTPSQAQPHHYHRYQMPAAEYPVHQ